MTARQGRHLVLQFFRRCVQLTVVLLVGGLIFLGLYHHYYFSRTTDDIVATPGWRGEVLRRVDDRVARLRNPESFLDDNQGNLWSMRLGGFDLADPLALAEATAAARTLHFPLAAAIVVPVVLTFLLGRVFCSWICPGYLVFEITGKLRKVLRAAGLQPADLRFAHTNKYLLLGVGLALAVATGLPIFSLVYPPALLSRAAHAAIFGTAVTGMVTILVLVIAFEVLVSPRWWCRSICPGGALYGLLGALRPLRVRVGRGCTNCGLCHPVCEEGLNVIKESAGIECDNCGACIRRCPEAVIEFKLRRAR